MIHLYWKGKFAKHSDILQECEQYLFDACGEVDHDVDISIDLMTELDDQLGGYCYGDNEHITIAIARRSEKQYFTRNEILRNLMHELIHAKQLILKEIDHGFLTRRYEDHPWEIEAYGNEDALCEKYFRKFLTT